MKVSLNNDVVIAFNNDNKQVRKWPTFRSFRRWLAASVKGLKVTGGSRGGSAGPPRWETKERRSAPQIKDDWTGHSKICRGNHQVIYGRPWDLWGIFLGDCWTIFMGCLGYSSHPWHSLTLLRIFFNRVWEVGIIFTRLCDALGSLRDFSGIVEPFSWDGWDIWTVLWDPWPISTGFWDSWEFTEGILRILGPFPWDWKGSLGITVRVRVPWDTWGYSRCMLQ